MIEPQKVAIFAVHRQDNLTPFENTHLYSEVVLLDKTFSSNHPLLYRLHLEALGLEDPLFNVSALSKSFHQHVELITGEVSQINKQKKEIILSDMSTVRYKYLIVMNSALHDALGVYKDEAFAAGLSTLQDALKIKSYFNERLPSHSSRKSKLFKNSPNFSIENRELLQTVLKNSNICTSSKPTLQPRILLEVLM